MRTPDVMLELNLQFFAAEGPGGEKTEEPTAKKKQDTRKDGKVAKSKELSSGVELIALCLILKFWIGNMGEGFLELFQNIYEKFPQYTTYWGGNIAKRDYSILFRDVYIDILKLLLPFFTVGVAIAFIVNMVQFKFQVSAKPLQPKFSKLNPVSGMKRVNLAFRQGKCGFLDMGDIIARTLDKATVIQKPTLDDYLASDLEARRIASEFLHL